MSYHWPYLMILSGSYRMLALKSEYQCSFLDISGPLPQYNKCVIMSKIFFMVQLKQCFLGSNSQLLKILIQQLHQIMEILIMGLRMMMEVSSHLEVSLGILLNNEMKFHLSFILEFIYYSTLRNFTLDLCYLGIPC